MGDMEEAATKNDVVKIKELASLRPVLVNSRGIWAWTPLMRAADNDKFDACRVLIEECDANVDLHDEWGHTALHIAATKGFEKIVKLLLKHKADVDFVDAVGRTPLMLACFNGHCETARTLLCYGAAIDKKSQENMNAMDMAKKGGRKEVYILLYYVINHGRENLLRGNDICIKCDCTKCKTDRGDLQAAVEKLNEKVETMGTDHQDMRNTIEKLDGQMGKLNVGTSKSAQHDDYNRAHQNYPGPPVSPDSSGRSLDYPTSNLSSPRSSISGFEASYGQSQLHAHMYGQVQTDNWVQAQQPHQPNSQPQMHGQFSPGITANTSPGLRQWASQPRTAPQHVDYTHPHNPHSEVPGLSLLQPSAKVSDKILKLIADQLGNDNLSFAIELGVEQPEIQGSHPTPSAASFAVLSKWKGRLKPFTPEKERFRQLFSALATAERNDIIEKVVKATSDYGH